MPAAHQETENAEKWEQRGGLEGRLLARFRRRLLAEAAALGPASVLDAGCGEGIVSGWLAAALPAARVEGLELRPDAVAEFGRRNPGLAIRRGEIGAMPFDDDAFDLAVAVEVLEHLDDPRAALRELRRVSRGHVLVTVPLEPWFRAGNLTRGRHLRRLGSTPGHQSTWGPRGFARLVGSELPGGRWIELFPWQGVVAPAGRA
jgi:SAM-dependent methyltransferase